MPARKRTGSAKSKPATSAILGARVERHELYKTPSRIYDIDAPASKRDPKKIADAYVKEIAPTLKVEVSDLKFDKVKDSILGSHVLYQQQHEGVPISRAWLRVDVAKDGRVFEVMNDLVPEAFLVKTRKKQAQMKSVAAEAEPITGDDADARAMNGVRTTDSGKTTALEHELLYLPVNGVPTLCWKVIVTTEKPPGSWKIYIDAHTGSVVERIDLLKRATGKGRVFDPNPVVALNDPTLEDDSKIPDSAYRDVDLERLDGKGALDGKYVTTSSTPNRTNSSALQFLFRREDRPFKEVMVYFHIDRVRKHLGDLGFDDVMDHAIEVNIDGETDDNSHYDPATKSLTFGTGGVDDAEDAEIILHEYGHAIQDDQVPGFGEGRETGAMGEAFGDFLAASFFADVKPASMRPTLGNWDATAYSGDVPPSLRRLDSNKKYPKDLTGEVHDDGEIWSACLWQLRSEVGRTTAETLVLAHHHLLTRTATFEEAANALITADKQLNAGKNEQTIRDIFIRRGILPNPKRKNLRAGTPFSGIVPSPAGK
jgi:Zn-dependent metalloprotease